MIPMESKVKQTQEKTQGEKRGRNKAKTKEEEEEAKADERKSLSVPVFIIAGMWHVCFRRVIPRNS